MMSSSTRYVEYLGGSATFSGLTIGIPIVLSAIVLIPLMKLDQGLSYLSFEALIYLLRKAELVTGAYVRPLHFACASCLVGKYYVCPHVSCTLPVSHPHKLHRPQAVLHLFHVLQALLLRRAHRRRVQADYARKLASCRPERR